MLKKIRLIAIFIALIMTVEMADAKTFINPIASAIKKSEISNSALISVSFKELSSEKTGFELNEKTPMSPASIQKLVTLLPAIDTLGKDYEFKTQLYKNKNNDLYIKLGADPYLTAKDLKSIIRTLNNNKICSTKSFSIDDSILDGNEWGEGWQWDDDLNPLMPKFSAYNIDKNLITVSVCPTIKGAPADISTNVFYPTAFVNNIVTADSNNVKLERKNYISPDVINADGSVSAEIIKQIPVNYPRRYFILRLEESLRDQKISYYGDFNRRKIPADATLVAEIKHPIASAQEDILKKSNNMVAETVFKLAGGKFAKETGSTASAVEMLKDYYKRQGISTENINIVDGSGVSKNNLVTADFMTDILSNAPSSPCFEDFKSHMATPGEGTLTDRMLYFKDNLKAKTGTLSNISAIAGYLTMNSGKTFAFCIITNDSKSNDGDKKAFEEYVLRMAYDEL